MRGILAMLAVAAIVLCVGCGDDKQPAGDVGTPESPPAMKTPEKAPEAPVKAPEAPAVMVEFECSTPDCDKTKQVAVGAQPPS